MLYLDCSYSVLAACQFDKEVKVSVNRTNFVYISLCNPNEMFNVLYQQLHGSTCCSQLCRLHTNLICGLDHNIPCNIIKDKLVASCIRFRSSFDFIRWWKPQIVHDASLLAFLYRLYFKIICFPICLRDFYVVNITRTEEELSVQASDEHGVSQLGGGVAHLRGMR